MPDLACEVDCRYITHKEERQRTPSLQHPTDLPSLCYLHEGDKVFLILILILVFFHFFQREDFFVAYSHGPSPFAVVVVVVDVAETRYKKVSEST